MHCIKSNDIKKICVSDYNLHPNSAELDLFCFRMQGPSSTYCWPIVGSLLKHVRNGRVRNGRIGNGWKMIDTETPEIWSVCEQDFEQLTVGLLLSNYWQIVR